MKWNIFISVMVKKEVERNIGYGENTTNTEKLENFLKILRRKD